MSEPTCRRVGSGVRRPTDRRGAFGVRISKSVVIPLPGGGFMTDSGGISKGVAALSWEQLKGLAYQRVSARVDLGQVGLVSSEEVRQELFATVDHTCRAELPPL